MVTNDELLARVEELNAIGISLSAEQNREKMLERILIGAKKITNADGGTLYLVKDNHLHFEIMRTASLNITKGGTTGEAITLKPVQLYNENQVPNTSSVATFAAISGLTVNIADAYDHTGEFDFSGTKAYDEQTGYHSKSFLTVPMKNHENQIIGVLQLINALDRTSNEVISFSMEDQQLVESLASQAAITLTNQLLISELRTLIEKFVEVIAFTIDEKSPYTGGHCRRVPDIAMRIAEGVNDCNNGPLAEVNFSEEDLYELKIAALLHDCGKITTPVHVVDKSSKLETIYDRIENVQLRFELIRKERELALLKMQIAEQSEFKPNDHAQKLYKEMMQKLDGDQEFLAQMNKGAEFMEDAHKARVHEIGSYSYQLHTGEHRPLLNADEIENLCVNRGTLNDKERELINNHVVTSINMLAQLPFPRYLRNVPEIAGSHHEHMDGSGYPRGLT
ncbi:MAG: GAF domain-containing protein, partial [Gammaproteobacteria bacterium]|nr:GAF domain-containing protein [Gammaproteobacteria bacterium]